MLSHYVNVVLGLYVLSSTGICMLISTQAEMAKSNFCSWNIAQ